MSDADKRPSREASGRLRTPGSGAGPCGSPTSCVYARARTFVRACVCTGPVAAPVEACAGWGLACPGLARHPTPLPRVPGARCGRAGPETSPSCCAQFQGSHPLACCPQSSPALAPVPWASRKALGGPAPSPARLGPPPRPTPRRDVQPTSSRSVRAPRSQNQERSEQSLLVEPPGAFARDPQGSAHAGAGGALRSERLNLANGRTVPRTTRVHVGTQVHAVGVLSHAGARTRQDIRKCGMSLLMAV